MGDLTILFGANDVGKSRLLRTIADGTASLDLLARGEPFAGG
jgi:ABC-type branched-subunit amino acid transport system ATPase component